MDLHGVTIDSRSARYMEDGFSIECTDQFYNLRFAVVNVGKHIVEYEDCMTGHSREYLYPNNNITKRDLTFGSEKKDAFIFSAKIDRSGKVQRFEVVEGSFAAMEMYSFTSDVGDDPTVKYGYEVMNLISEAGVHTSICRSHNLNQLMQNIVTFFSLELFTYVVDILGLSVFHTCVSSAGLLGGGEHKCRPDVGRLYPLGQSYGLRIVNGEGSVVTTQTQKGSFLTNMDRVAGLYFMPISSPFRSDEALLNQIILYRFLVGDLFEYIEGCDYGFVGPSPQWRAKYLKAISNRFVSSTKANKHELTSIQNLTGKLLKSAIVMMVDDGIVSSQLDTLTEEKGLSEQDKAYLCSFYFATNSCLPEVLSQWVDHLASSHSGSLSAFYNIVSGMPFVHSYVVGGVVTFEINNRIYEVDDCGDSSVRLLRKIKAGFCRNSLEIPKSKENKIKLYQKLSIDPDIADYLTSVRG